MNNNFDKELLTIINHYGVLPQLKYFQSEVFELNEAIIEKENNPIRPILNVIDRINNRKDSKINHIAEELADVAVMLLQFKEYYNIDGQAILDIMNQKIKRQLDRIESEMK